MHRIFYLDNSGRKSYNQQNYPYLDVLLFGNQAEQSSAVLHAYSLMFFKSLDTENCVACSTFCTLLSGELQRRELQVMQLSILRKLSLRKLPTLVRETTRIENSRAFKNLVFDEANLIFETSKTY